MSDNATFLLSLAIIGAIYLGSRWFDGWDRECDRDEHDDSGAAKVKLLVIVAALLAAVGLLAGCTGHHPNTHAAATKNDQKVSNDILAHFQQVQPAPQFDWSQIRQTLIDAETAQAQTTQTTTFFFNLGVADPVGWCPSIGFPVAGTSEITSPDKENYHGSYGQSVTAQIDPNGIFAGSTTATYVICVGENGKKYLHHVEEFAHAVGGPATWDYVHHRFQITGDPTFTPKTSK